MTELQTIAGELGGRLEEPKLLWKYAWIRPIFGFQVAKRAQMVLPQVKAMVLSKCDKAMYELQGRNGAALNGVKRRPSNNENENERERA
jgi:hypothetical protein